MIEQGQSMYGIHLWKNWSNLFLSDSRGRECTNIVSQTFPYFKESRNVISFFCRNFLQLWYCEGFLWFIVYVLSCPPFPWG